MDSLGTIALMVLGLNVSSSLRLSLIRRRIPIIANGRTSCTIYCLIFSNAKREDIIVLDTVRYYSTLSRGENWGSDDLRRRTMISCGRQGYGGVTRRRDDDRSPSCCCFLRGWINTEEVLVQWESIVPNYFNVYFETTTFMSTGWGLDSGTTAMIFRLIQESGTVAMIFCLIQESGTVAMIFRSPLGSCFSISRPVWSEHEQWTSLENIRPRLNWNEITKIHKRKALLV